MNMDTIQKELDYEIFVMQIFEMNSYSKITHKKSSRFTPRVLLEKHGNLNSL